MLSNPIFIAKSHDRNDIIPKNEFNKFAITQIHSDEIFILGWNAIAAVEFTKGKRLLFKECRNWGKSEKQGYINAVFDEIITLGVTTCTVFAVYSDKFIIFGHLDEGYLEEGSKILGEMLERYKDYFDDKPLVFVDRIAAAKEDTDKDKKSFNEDDFAAMLKQKAESMGGSYREYIRYYHIFTVNEPDVPSACDKHDQIGFYISERGFEIFGDISRLYFGPHSGDDYEEISEFNNMEELAELAQKRGWV